MLECLKFPRKEVFDKAATVCGLILASIQKLKTNLVDITQNFSVTLESILMSKLLKDDGESAVASCLKSITRYHPDFLSREMLLRLFSMLSRIPSKAKMDALEVLLRIPKGSDHYENIAIIEYLKPHLLSFLADLTSVTLGRAAGEKSSRLPMVQINTILLLSNYDKVLDLDTISLILGGSSSEGINLVINGKTVLRAREVAYDFLMSLFLNNKALSDEDSPKGTHIKKLILVMLLGGLTDPDMEGMNNSSTSSTDKNIGRIGIRKKLYDFFHQLFGSQNNSNFVSRLNLLFTELFDVTKCDRWLHFASYLLLSPAADTREFSTPLFPNGLADENSYVPLQVIIYN